MQMFKTLPTNVTEFLIGPKAREQLDNIFPYNLLYLTVCTNYRVKHNEV